jgi:transcriptional regulator with XRE-family HTH domain
MGMMNVIYEQLRKAIEASRKTRYQLWQETDIDQGQLSRFMAGGAGLSVENIEKLAEALGLEIIIRPKRRQAKGR